METLDQPLNTQTIITPLAVHNLKRTWQWMVFVGVLFLLTAAFMVMMGIATIVSSNEASSQGLDSAIILMGVFFILWSGLFGFAGILAIQAGNKISSFVNFNNATTFEHITAYQQRFWLLMGVYGISVFVFIIGFSILARKAMALAV